MGQGAVTPMVAVEAGDWGVGLYVQREIFIKICLSFFGFSRQNKKTKKPPKQTNKKTPNTSIQFPWIIMTEIILKRYDLFLL